MEVIRNVNLPYLLLFSRSPFESVWLTNLCPRKRVPQTLYFCELSLAADECSECQYRFRESRPPQGQTRAETEGGLFELPALHKNIPAQQN
jgi:hypothetical protein